MSKILVISQNENDVWFVNGLSIGRREPRNIWGDKIKEVLKEKNISEEEFVNSFGTSYQENIKRVLKNEEFPKKQVVEKILQLLDKELTYFHDKELENVIVNDSRMILAEYSSNERAKQVMELVKANIMNSYNEGKPIIVNLPKDNKE